MAFLFLFLPSITLHFKLFHFLPSLSSWQSLCVYIFRNEHLVLNNGLWYSFLGKSNSPSISLSKGWIPLQFSSSALTRLLVLPLFMSCLLDNFQDSQSHNKHPDLLAVPIFLLPLLWYFLSHRCGSCDLDIFCGSWISYSLLIAVLWPVSTFCNSLHFL